MKIRCVIFSAIAMISGCNEVDSDIDVYISTGKLQCQGNGLAIVVTKGYLLDAGIEVKTESCGYLTQISHATVCGAGTRNLHIFTINKNDSQAAENLGFIIPKSSVLEDDYEKIECDT